MVSSKAIPIKFSLSRISISNKRLNRKFQVYHIYRILKFDVRSVPFSNSSSRIDDGYAANSELKKNKC